MILQQLHDGACRKPFVTHINTYSMDLFLRAQSSTSSACASAAGTGIQLGRAFRNEAVDFSLNPSSPYWAYQAHADYLEWIDGCRRHQNANPGRQQGAHRHAAPDGQSSDGTRHATSNGRHLRDMAGADGA